MEPKRRYRTPLIMCLQADRRDLSRQKMSCHSIYVLLCIEGMFTMLFIHLNIQDNNRHINEMYKVS